jgi:hypothetical protein
MRDSHPRGNLPNVQNLLVKAPLYAKYDISAPPDEAIWGIEYFRGSIDAYCVECKEPSIFKGEMPPRSDYSGQGGLPSGYESIGKRYA